MSKRVVLAVIVLVLLVACGESKVTGRRVAIPDSSAPTAAVIAQQSSPSAETGKTAAEMLKELQSSPTTITQTGEKSGNFYPPIAVTGTEREALRQKTRALFSQPTYDPNTEAEGDFGAKYHDNDGDPSNLPSGYSDNSGD